MNLRTLFLLIGITFLFAGCAGKGDEISDNDADETLRPSPCACLEIEDYDGRGFKWQKI